MRSNHDVGVGEADFVQIVAARVEAKVAGSIGSNESASFDIVAADKVSGKTV